MNPVKTPAKKRIRKKDEVIGIPEPVRVSLYDIILRNLKTAKRVTFVHRIFYLGEYKYIGPEKLCQFFEESLNMVNKSHVDEKVTGFLLYYAKYFIIMLESSERELHKQLSIITDKDNSKYFTRIKVLLYIPHINQRFHDGFLKHTDVPSTLVDTIDPQSDIRLTMNHALICIKKMYKLINAIVNNDIPDTPTEETTNTEEGRVSISSAVSLQLLYPSPATKYREFLPEYELIDFLLGTKHLLNMDQFYQISSTPLPLNQYSDNIWPAPADFAPADIFGETYNPVLELPKPKPAESKADVSSLEISRHGSIHEH